MGHHSAKVAVRGPIFHQRAVSGRGAGGPGRGAWPGASAPILGMCGNGVKAAVNTPVFSLQPALK